MNLKLALGGALLGLAAMAGAGSAEPGKPRVKTYSAKAIYALSFHGVHLGLTFDQVCQTLTEQGYSRRPFDFPDDPPCSQKHVDSENLIETYFGKGWNKPEDIAGKPIASVSFITLTYARKRGQLIVRAISVTTDERNQEDRLEQTAISDWGEPTQLNRWGYRVLTYAPSADQADFYHRSDFRSCSMWDGCDDKSGTECHRIMHRYAVPFASQVIYDWGRWIEIEDGRAVLAEVKASGLLERMRTNRVQSFCPVPSVH